jgi:hypothetical protein
MTHDETQTGTPVLEMSAGEYRDFLDDAARQRLGMSAEEFRHRYIAGERRQRPRCRVACGPDRDRSKR